MTKQTYWTLSPITHNARSIQEHEPIELTPKQAANWLAAGKLSETKPTKRNAKTQGKEVNHD
ncbi:hypothetical protein N473_06850 [Pseudoalteromonas luteoviolacea CPMOR-1]|uniref:Uncharacterized protein n=1 Tax=Pseudoalteromonas luteoviolacea CPMOR-1 TaxID=1365248 RepID=A0A167H3N3_9GAMM|nr:hypothetical protein [Pseudoalteromonas luteoviolacea]KZN57597.1 hypothetical protein N473_06850 [Pseudoalteromonas luteoviolacea CPMOR-1]